jgi:hypothetical protein
VRDDTDITNSLQLSYLNELHGQFALERFLILKKKSEYMIAQLGAVETRCPAARAG